MTDPNPRDLASIHLTEDGAAFWKLHIVYREVDVRILFSREEHGIQEVVALMNRLPGIVGAGLREAKVREEMRNLDGEIEDLLGDDE
jgi:hypothetical protein